MSEILPGSGIHRAEQLQRLHDMPELLDDLSDRMRIFDERDRVLRKLQQEQYILEMTLADIDLELPLYSHPASIVYNALELYLAQGDLQDAEQSRDTPALQADPRVEQSFVGLRAIVTAVEPARHMIGTSRRNPYGELDGQSKYHISRRGSIDELSLDTTSGGYVMLHGRWGNLYIAGPLVDRNADYTPAFEIELLDDARR